MLPYGGLPECKQPFVEQRVTSCGAASEMTYLASKILAGVRLRMACLLPWQCRKSRIFVAGLERESSKTSP